MLHCFLQDETEKYPMVNRKINHHRTGVPSLETFAEPKALVENSHFKVQKQKSLTGLSDAVIDAPIIEI
jgi:hypothetical protein